VTEAGRRFILIEAAVSHGPIKLFCITCRAFFLQEIVVFREDIVTKICRNCVYFPESGDIPSHFSRTILSQGHLAPLPLHVIPTYWDHDRAMWIYPLPDLVVVGDKFDPFTTSQVIRLIYQYF
jgi:DNA polymerase alpha/epsilon subunit B